MTEPARSRVPGDGGPGERGRFDAAAFAVAGVAGALAIHNVLVHRFLPRSFHMPLSAVTAAVALGLTKAAGATLDEVGLGSTNAEKGIKVGSAAAGAVGTGITVAMLIPVGRRYFARSAQESVRKRTIAYDTVIRIPWLTAAFEEVVFRGALFGLLERRYSTNVALAGSSAAFAAWHVLPALPGAGGIQDTWDRAQPLAAVLGSLAITGVAGLIFGGLRARSGSVIAPFLAHSATNTGGYLAAQVARAHEDKQALLFAGGGNRG